jgi:hypothetical protein
LKDINDANQIKLKYISKSYSANKQAAFKYLVEKLSKYFISDNYNISSFLGHYLLYENRESSPLKADAVIYPSLQAGLKNMNLAFHPDYVAKHMELKQVQKVIFENFEESGSWLSLSEVGLPDTVGNIDWYAATFNKNAMKIMSIEVKFNNEPSKEHLNENSIFIKSNKEYKLLDLTWELIDKNLEKYINVISRLNQEIDINKIYDKTIFITPAKNIIYIEITNEKYFVDVIKVKLKFKIALKKI